MNVELTKLTFKVYPPVWARISKNLNELCLNRDAFFAKLIKYEITELENELRDKPKQTAQSKNFLSKKLVTIGNSDSELKTISIQMPKETAKALRDVVKKYNLYRDGFFNRLCIFLDISDTIFKHFKFPKHPPTSNEQFSTRPLIAMDQAQANPFYYFREHLLQNQQEGIYTVSFPPKINGFSCYIEDHEVSGTKAYKKSEELRKLLLADRTIDDAFSN